MEKNYKMINEHWRKADELVEIVSLKNGSNLAVHIKDGHALIFASVYELALYQVGGKDIRRLYCEETLLEKIYETYSSFNQLEQYANTAHGSTVVTAAGATIEELEAAEINKPKFYFQISYMAKQFGMTGLLYGTEGIHTTEYPTRKQLIAHVMKTTPTLEESSISIMGLMPQTKQQWDNYHK